MKDRAAIFFATGAYAGYSPFMPGTVGTLLGLPIAYLASSEPFYIQALAIFAVSSASVIAAGRAAKIIGKKDPSSVVCDEIAGFLTAFFLIPFTAFNAILVFLLFRFFDILKPYPIRYIERFEGGLGIVLDDLMAGVYANISALTIINILK